jgi:hypothetical protein
MADQHGSAASTKDTIHLPAPTAWPILLAAGLTLLFAALVTNVGIGIFGAFLTVISCVGWFRQVLPHENHELLDVETAPIEVTTARQKVARIQLSETHRAQLPLATYPVSSGIKGGLAGGLAMIIPAEIYGLLRFHSVWYSINLLGGAGVAGWLNPTDEQIATFHFGAFVMASIIHLLTSLLVGLLYGALLPVWPKRPILLGGLIAPVIWTGLLHNVLGIIDPFFDQKISWWWFAASQVFFGLVAGITVTKLGNLKQLRQVPLSVRLGLETPGLHMEHDEQGGKDHQR